MRSIIRGIPPRSGDRIFPQPNKCSDSPPARRFFSGGVVHTSTAQLARDFAAAVASPDLPSGFGCVGFVRLIRLVSDVRSGRVRGFFNRVSLRGGCCGVGGFVASAGFVARGFFGVGLGLCRERRTPAELGGRVSAGVVPRWGVLGLVVGWWYFAACGVGGEVERGEHLG